MHDPGSLNWANVKVASWVMKTFSSSGSNKNLNKKNKSYLPK